VQLDAGAEDDSLVEKVVAAPSGGQIPEAALGAKDAGWKRPAPVSIGERDPLHAGLVGRHHQEDFAAW